MTAHKIDYGKQGVVLDDSDDTGGYYGNYDDYGHKKDGNECSSNDSDYDDDDVSHSNDNDEFS